METASLLWKSAWDILLIIIGLVLLFMAFRTEKSLSENETSLKIPLFIFYDSSK